MVVALCVSLVCSIVVSGTAVALKERQDRNVLLDMQYNVLAAAGMELDERGVAVIFAQEFEQHIVDLRTGDLVPEVDAAGFDQLKTARDPELSTPLSKDRDIATLLRRENHASVYMKRSPDGSLEKLVLPVRGYGLWGTLYGFLALEADLQTVAGLTFYQHKETPGLGGEVDNSKWRAIWPGKRIFDENGNPAIRLVKTVRDPTHEVDALAGATLTTRGVENLVRFWVSDLGYGPFLDKLSTSGIRTR